MILDLNNARTNPLGIVASMKEDPALASIPTVGYASHVQTDVINAARQAGVGEVLARSAFTIQLADILRRVILNDVYSCAEADLAVRGRTTLSESPWLSDLGGATVSLKLESLQRSNSFKLRGAFNAVIARLERGDASGLKLVTASAGNHGRALASAAQVFQLPLVVFTPDDAPQTKLAAIRRHGAELRAEGSRLRPRGDPRKTVRAGHRRHVHLAVQRPLTSSPARQPLHWKSSKMRRSRTRLSCRLAGGGLISGVAAAVKALAPVCVVFGVEVEVSCAFQTSVRAGKLVDIVAGQSLADGLGGNPDPQTITFDFVQRYVDQIVTVSESDLAAAIVGLIEHEHLIAEGAGAAATAAIVGRRVDVAGRRVAVILSGSNIDRARLTEAY